MAALQIIPLVASMLTTVAPAMQLLQIRRTRSVKGLSTLTGMLLVIGASLAFLLGVQYGLGPVLIFMGLSVVFQALLLHFISWRGSLALWASAVLGLVFIVTLAPGLAADLLRQRCTQEIAVLWGVIAAGTFIPQVLATRRTRQTRDISLFMVVCLATGMTLWTAFAWIIGNWSLLLWSGIMALSLYELLRLKLTIPAVPSAAARA